MVVCKFFQQGYCRYGQNCRFDHVYGSKYSYHANPQPQLSAPPPTTGVTDEQLINQVQSDVQAALRGGQWILSCYSPFKEKPIFPGIPDLSQEEARLFIYEAKANNNVDQAVAYINNLFTESRQKYEQLLQPNVNIIKVLKSLYKGEVVSSPFSNTAQNSLNNASDSASSIFRSAVQSTPFSQNTAQSMFSQAQNTIFNSQPSDPAKDLFSRANNASVFNSNQSAPSGSPFATQNNAQSIFASAVQNNFAQSSPSSIFAAANQNVFAKESISQMDQNNSAFSQGNVFQKFNQGSVFAQSNDNRQDDNPGVYSKMEDLSEEDLDAYKGESFELGFVPELPPPHALCSSTKIGMF